MKFNSDYLGSITVKAANALRPPQPSEFARCPNCGHPLQFAFVTAKYRLHCGHCTAEVRLVTRMERGLTTTF